MKITRKVEIQVLHRHDLGITAARRTALDTEARSERRLTQGNDSLFPQSGKSLPKSHGDRSLPLPSRGGIDRRHQNQPPFRVLFELLYVFFRKLRLIFAVNLQIFLFDTDLPRHLRDRDQFRRLRDFNVSLHNFLQESVQTPPRSSKSYAAWSPLPRLQPESGTGGTPGGAGDADSEYDEYFAEAGRFIIEKDKASIGMLQRMFKIGFNRAARIMDQLCDAGVVGEEEGTKPRKILMSAAEFEQILGGNYED